MKGSGGFTLIEVLIVAVIIGILAALIMPRFMSAPEKVIVAEANQMLSALIQAQQRHIDMGGNMVTNDPLTAADWNTLGMQVPGGRFTYGCAGMTCTATRAAGGGVAGTLTLTTANVWNCTGAYSASVPAGFGCRIEQ